VRARAYKVAVTATSNYPAITMATPNLRTAIRTERRMELAHEALRYMDIVRWKLASKVLKRSIYGNLDPADLKTKVVDKGLWPFPGIPTIDEDGTPDFKAMEATGLIKVLSPCAWDDRQYLWPIPTAELQINPNMKQNPGY
jgi:starch-binding outer membrane protein, SusD/RagB family